MIPFEYSLQKGDVKKTAIDRELAKSLIKDMKERIDKSLILDIDIFSKFVFENVYDALRDFCDFLLALKGYKSYSHQASIAFLLKEGFDISIIEELDQFRAKRIGSKYYGKSISSGDALQIKDFYLKNKNKFESVIREKLK